MENTGVVCFTSGTAIRTPKGEVSIEDLQVGDLICTLDNGPQPIRWIGRREVRAEELAADEKMRPVVIPKGMSGAQRDLLVSRQHAIMMGNGHLARAIHLAETKGLRARVAHGKKQVTYVHLMFDAHQIIFAENVASESFYPGANAIDMLTPKALTDLKRAFPEFVNAKRTKDMADIYGPTARPIAERIDVTAAKCMPRWSRSQSHASPGSSRWLEAV